MVWQPPRPSTASRTPPKRGKGSFRGATADPVENREKVFESYRLERGLFLMLLADRCVARVQDQPAPGGLLNRRRGPALRVRRSRR